MRFLWLLILFVTRYSMADGQSIQDDPKWNSYLQSITAFNQSIYEITGKQFNDQYSKSNYYDILLVYLDGTWTEEKVVFLGIVDLCDRQKPLNIKRRDRDEVSPMPKSKYAFFVFDNRYTFKFTSPGTGTSSTATWGIVYLSGPIYCMKSFTQPDPSFDISERHTTCKKDRVIGSNVIMDNYFGGFKSSFSKYVKEDTELADKITNDVEGYRKENKVTILQEYNAWVKQTDPELYARYVYTH